MKTFSGRVDAGKGGLRLSRRRSIYLAPAGTPAYKCFRHEQ